MHNGFHLISVCLNLVFALSGIFLDGKYFSFLVFSYILHIYLHQCKLSDWLDISLKQNHILIPEIWKLRYENYAENALIRSINKLQIQALNFELSGIQFHCKKLLKTKTYRIQFVLVVCRLQKFTSKILHKNLSYCINVFNIVRYILDVIK